MTISTLAVAKKLTETGFSAQQAETLAEIVNESESGGWRSRIETRITRLEAILAVNTAMTLAVLLRVFWN